MLLVGYRTNGQILYPDELEKAKETGDVQSVDYAISRQGDKEHIQDLLVKSEVQAKLQFLLKQGGHIYVCGKLPIVNVVKDVVLTIDSSIVDQKRFHQDVYFETFTKNWFQIWPINFYCTKIDHL